MSDALRDVLPNKLAEIAEIIGVEAALKLSKHFPGIRIWLSKNMRADNPVANAIGVAAARKLGRHYDGEYVVIPMAKEIHQLKLKAKVLQELAAGAKAGELARKYGVHQYTIYRWQGESMSASQMKLFSEAL